jgi:hypothetical protein
MHEAAMSKTLLVSVDHPELKPLPISPRLRTQLVYFMSSPDSAGVPPLKEGEYWIARKDVTEWLMEGIFYLVSPLDSGNVTDVELSEEQEAMLSWLAKNNVQHIRVVE